MNECVGVSGKASNVWSYFLCYEPDSMVDIPDVTVTVKSACPLSGRQKKVTLMTMTTATKRIIRDV